MGGSSIDWTEIVRRALIVIEERTRKRGDDDMERCEMSVLMGLKLLGECAKSP